MVIIYLLHQLLNKEWLSLFEFSWDSVRKKVILLSIFVIKLLHIHYRKVEKYGKEVLDNTAKKNFSNTGRILKTRII